MPFACCYLPLAGLARHVSPHVGKHAATPAGGSDWITVAPNWISAVATVGLLIGAIITAGYAIMAFDKQSEQLEDQREINKLQARDLETSLEERKRLRQVAEREQANDIGFAWWPASHVLIVNPPVRPPPSTPRHPEAIAHADTSGMAVLVVDNASRRRILDVTCRIEPAEGADLTLPRNT